ncbi:hypothetical protein BO71DRAFT_445399 [Aspergillus ellipticus CBS 707.79]|uniref:Uncharacterized protein n=1 Tax=Aspergillus ellipticus CBS 707.79 TaxID=1448320 RepID=A0A319DB10_9EURO|nr:hypothetical protein BO71DRAFT_445399 [Aspergillus ellipticus CBS 707.79]
MSLFEERPLEAEHKLASKIAKILDDARIPNVIWSDIMNSILGITNFLYIQVVITFVVEDKDLNKAIAALKKAKLCKSSHGHCPFRFRRTEATPWPSYHCHASSALDAPIISLVRKSESLWDLPSLPLQFPIRDDPNFMLSTDCRLPGDESPGMGDGRFDESLYPVKTMIPARWIESLYLLEARDLPFRCQGRYWRGLLDDFERHSRELIPLSLLIFQPHFLPSWRATQYTASSNSIAFDRRKCSDLLREKLAKQRALPNPLIRTSNETHQLQFNKQRRRKLRMSFADWRAYKANDVQEDDNASSEDDFEQDEVCDIQPDVDNYTFLGDNYMSDNYGYGYGYLDDDDDEWPECPPSPKYESPENKEQKKGKPKHRHEHKDKHEGQDEEYMPLEDEPLPFFPGLESSGV